MLVHALCAGLLDTGLGGGGTTTPVFAISNSETTKQQMLRRELQAKQAAPAAEDYMDKSKEVSKLPTPTTQQGAAANLVKLLGLTEEDGSVERDGSATTNEGEVLTCATSYPYRR